MATVKKNGTAARRAEIGSERGGCGDGERVQRGAERLQSVAAMIRGLLKTAEAKVGAGDLKALGDYLKLVQMLKEVEEQEPREIKVTWVQSEKELEDSESKPSE
jgi:hypothetical protein